ncbi:MAG TPA: hypothetical protein VF071_01940 [Candidatus Limnocylindria bacterium]
MAGAVILKVGDMHHLRRGKDRIVYAGMPGADVYSIVQMKWEFGYRGYAWNLYFPREENRIRIDGVNLAVESVGPDAITLRS